MNDAKLALPATVASTVQYVPDSGLAVGSTWRPEQQIKVKVIGLVWRERQLLVAEVTLSTGQLAGVRPLGGSVEFGETRETALVREFGEELGTAIEIVGPWMALENLFEYEGALGHEIVFAAEIRLADRQIHARDAFLFHEADGTPCRARWVSLDDLRASGTKLFPVGLLEALERFPT
ncbi:NUDIX hydrolase [Oryzibacter oryziterrae]|uniref:NUDIX hydrolase n=1 Tax=Oryzibacter oryziterrae TaxID=2766474 RepID=UPI001F300468|nr:NUDIX domain-containing protein [Oryzibacter oryziterrae]